MRRPVALVDAADGGGVVLVLAILGAYAFLGCACPPPGCAPLRVAVEAAPSPISDAGRSGARRLLVHDVPVEGPGDLPRQQLDDRLRGLRHGGVALGGAAERVRQIRVRSLPVGDQAGAQLRQRRDERGDARARRDRRGELLAVVAQEGCPCRGS